MKTIGLRIIRLFIGLFLYATGIVMTINANLGLAPWDVFHQGLSKTLNITIGQASIGVGLILIIYNSILKEKLGWATLGNMLFIGIFVDLLMINHLIPVFEGFFWRLAMLLMGIFVIGVASVFYIGAGFGTGPRDGLMVVLKKKTGKSIRFIRNSIEITALAIGYFLGGFVGLGTLITALSIGYIVQFVFRLFKFDVSEVEHRFIDEDIKLIRNIGNKKKSTSTDDSH